VSEIGKGALSVASSKRCKNEIVLVRDNILSMQFHPDLTSHLMMDKIWPAILRRGFVRSDLEPRAREEMSSVDTDESLEFIRDFFTS
jgi:GMP synthase-like glutamine amidotransferase